MTGVCGVWRKFARLVSRHDPHNAACSDGRLAWTVCVSGRADADDASTVLTRVGADAAVVSALTCDTRRVLDAGARGYLLLERLLDTDLVHAVRRVAAGECCVSPGLAVPERTPPLPTVDTAYQRLTQRERQVLALVARGRSNREIAATLHLSVNTVAVHRAGLKKTLAVRKTAALVLVAIRHGLVTAE